MRIRYSAEGEPLETGAGFARCCQGANPSRFVGDIWTDYDFTRLRQLLRGLAHLYGRQLASPIGWGFTLHQGVLMMVARQLTSVHFQCSTPVVRVVVRVPSLSAAAAGGHGERSGNGGKDDGTLDDVGTLSLGGGRTLLKAGMMLYRDADRRWGYLPRW